MYTEKLIHNPSLCKNCGLCIDACFRKNFYTDERDRVSLKDGYEKNCILCGHCTSACLSAGALTISGEEWSRGEDSIRIPGREAVMDLLKGRRSRRKFSDTDVTDDELDTLLNAARYAPSGHNSQNYHFTVTNDRGKIRTIGEAVLIFYGKITSLLSNRLTRPLVYLASGKSNYHVLMEMRHRLENHQKIFRETGSIEMTWDAPAMIMIHGPEGGATATNCALAGSHIMFQAEAMGLGTCILGLLGGGISHAAKDLNRAGISIPKGHSVYMILAVGHPDGNEKFKKVPPRRQAKVTRI